MPRSKAFLILILSLLVSSITTAAIAQEVSVARLIQALGSKQAETQIKAAKALSQRGANAAPATAALAKALRSPTVQVQNAAALALAAVGPGAKDGLPALTQALKDKNAGVRARAAYAIGKIGNVSDGTLEAMIAAALDPDVTVRRHVRDALRNIQAPREKTLPIWARTLKEANNEEIMPALMTLAEEGKAALPVLADALKHEDACYWATLIIAEIGPDAAPLTPNLIELLKHGDPETRMNALVALGEIGPGAAAASDEIIAHLNSEKSDNVLYAAAYALGAIETKETASPAAKAALAKLLNKPDLGLQSIAARGLLLIDPDGDNDEKAVKVTVQALASQDPNIRHLAVRTLSEMTPRGSEPSPEVIDAFVKVMNDSSPHVVGEVIGALAAQGKSATPRVIRGLGSKELRPYAVQVAILLGPDAADAVPALLSAWEDTSENDGLKPEIQFAFGAIGPASAPAVSKLIESLSSQSSEVRYSACYALGRIGPAAKAAVPKLMSLLGESDEFEKLAGVWALIRIEPNNAKLQARAIPLLTKALKDQRPHIRIQATASLAHLGSAAKSALPALQAAGKDADPNVAAAAKAAIAAISGK